MNSDTGTFWEHLEELRWMVLRSMGVAIVFAIAAFCMKDWLFRLVLAPHTSNFITYRLMGIEPFDIHLMNIGLTEQFMTHMRVAMYVPPPISSTNYSALSRQDSMQTSGGPGYGLWSAAM